MKKILIYTENYERGGGNQYLVDLVNALPHTYSILLVSNEGGLFDSDLGKIKNKFNYIQLSILSFHSINQRILLFTQNGIFLFFYKIIKHLFKPLFIFWFKHYNIKQISKIIHAHKPSLIISCNGGYPAALSCLDCVYAASIKHVPVWLTIVSTPQKISIIDFFYRKLITKVDKVIVNSAYTLKKLNQERNFPINKLEILYNSLPNSAIRYDSATYTPYSTASNEYILGYIGRIERSKGVFYLIDAFEKLSKEFSNLKLVIAGYGKDWNEIKELCEQKNITDKINLLGYYKGDIRDILNTFNLFVFPSLWEGLPYVVLEAMANGVLVVATTVGGIPELIKDGENGFLVSPANSNALYEKVKYILQSKNDYKLMINNSLSVINSAFSEDNFKAKLTAWIQQSV